MKKDKIAINIFAFLLLWKVSSAQEVGQVVPPQLRDRNVPGVNFYAGFRQQRDSATVITVKFKITETGFLDTLFVSSNAPTGYFDNIKKQLVALNGKWLPQKNQGKPEQSKWLIYRHYVMGPSGPSSRLWAEVELSYKRDYELFRCQHNPKRQMQCLTPYIEGPDFYLFPPEWYPTYQ